MVIAAIFKSRNVNPKMASRIFLKAGDEEAGCMQLTKAYCCLLKELSFIMPKADLHKFFTSSDIDIKDAMDKDCVGGTPAERLRDVYTPAYRNDLAFLLEPLVIIDWPQIEKDLVKLLEEHDFSTDATAEDFTKEFNFLESKVPQGPDGRGNPCFVRVIVNAVMAYSTQSEFSYLFQALPNKLSHSNSLIIDDGNNVSMKKTDGDLALTNCDLLLRKYAEHENAKLDTLFILAELFADYKNNQG